LKLKEKQPRKKNGCDSDEILIECVPESVEEEEEEEEKCIE